MTIEPFTTLDATAVVLPRDNVDTDQIIPARFLKTTERSGLGRHAFADWRYDAGGLPRADFPLNAPGARDARILIAGRNFGCGSSREHAAWALHSLGIRAVVSTSFADIFRANALSSGILPVVLREEEHGSVVHELAQNPALAVRVDLASQTLSLSGKPELSYMFPIDPFAKRCLLQGVDHLGYLLDAVAVIAAYEVAHPAPVRTC